MDINNPVHQSNVRRGHEFANISLDGNVGAHFGDVIIQNEIAADGFIRADIRKQGQSIYPLVKLRLIDLPQNCFQH